MSFNYNHVTLVGRLTKDPDVRSISDTVKSVFTLAVNRTYRKDNGETDTDFIVVIAWGRLAEIAQQYLFKGSPVLVEGRIQVRNYELDGDKRKTVEVLADNFQLLGGWPNSDSTNERDQASKKTAKSSKKDAIIA